MKNRYSFLAAVLFAIFVAACATQKGNEQPFLPTITGKWILSDTQSAGIGPPGVWATASPANRWMEIGQAGVISGSVFPSASGYQLVDSATVKVMDPTQAAGFFLFNFRLDTVQKALLFYKRPANGGYCIEGCGTYKFIR